MNAAGAPRVLMWVQHLVGVGHQRRSAAIARALARAGARVSYVCGGMPVAGLELDGCELIQLPPARSLDMRYHTLVDETGRAVDDAWRQRRAARLLEVVEARRPHALITETWPFGRGLLRFELEPLMAAVAAMRPRPLLVSSVRDIVEQRRDPAKLERMADRVLRHFDRVLVHSDPDLLPLADSFAPFARIAARVHHTGYVSTRQPVAARSPRPDGPVLVSAGGGFFGESLLLAALQAAAGDPRRGRRWHVLVGPNLPEARFRALAAQAGGRVVVERNRADFHALLDGCAVSVSQGGYNTVTDLLASRTPAVIVPYEDEREHEQAVRARHLAARGLAQVVPHGALTPGALLAAVDAAAGSPVPAAGVDLDGARRSAALLLGWIGEEVAPGGCQSRARG